MFLLHVGVDDIYEMIHTLNNLKTARACFGVYICNFLIILAFYQ